MKNENSLLSFVDAFAGKKALVLGDIMLDEYIVGSVERISPEAPIPIVHARERRFVLGGAANTASNLAALGARVSLFGLIGEDAAGKRVLELLREKGIDGSAVLVDAEQPTTRKVRVVAQQQQMLRIDFEEAKQLEAEQEKRVVSALQKKIPEIDAVVVSDYAKGFVSKRIVSELLGDAKKNKKIVCADSKDFLGLGFKGATLLKPNRKELAKETKIELKTSKEVLEASKKFFNALKPKALLVTLGADGMLLVEKSGTKEIRSVAQEVFDVSGAGDTVLAASALSLAAGASPEQAALIATNAASVVLRKLGTATLTAEELKKEIGKNNQ